MDNTKPMKNREGNTINEIKIGIISSFSIETTNTVKKIIVKRKYIDE
jgi:hypothetical protein